MLIDRVYGTLAALLVLSAGLATAQAVRDPLDGSSVQLPEPRLWNRAGGEDPDGCVHSIEADGSWRIAALDDVIAFPRTGLALKREHLQREFTPEQLAELRELLRRRSESGFELSDTYVTAAEVYLALGEAAGVGRAQIGDLFLRAAWAVRGGVEIPGATSFRPQTVAEGFTRLSELERQLEQEQTRLNGVDRVLDSLDRARGYLARLAPQSAGSRLAVEQVRHALFAVEQEALRLKAELPPEVQGPAPAERFVLLAWAAQRVGDPLARDRWLRRVSGEFGARLKGQVQALRAAFTAEEQLLARAGEHYAAALEQQLPAAEEARVACLLGETLRRRGQDGSEAYARALRAAPESAGGLRAKQLLESKR